ncbi:hypothetical protein SADUNF_Sadunf03G0126400 [Salix dunnii]|uniref:Uncharacterized protein n=1 Tax=Salix dunnii TaxID=1413687 RepID=A0A835TE05_9ROSI|nr:hypothetical protein SADUNF_Sadunf03G0126400 [Salix dunnii]
MRGGKVKVRPFGIPPPYPQPDFHPPPVPAPPPPGYQSYFHEEPAPPPLPPPSNAYHARHDHGGSSGCCSFLRGWQALSQVNVNVQLNIFFCKTLRNRVSII